MVKLDLIEKKIHKGGIYVAVSSSDKTAERITQLLKKISKKQKGAVICINQNYSSKIQSPNLYYIDLTGAEMPKGKGISFKRPISLTELSLAITSAVQMQKSGFLLFDSIESLLVHSDESTVEKFALFLVNKLRFLSVAGIFFVTSVNSKVARLLLMSCDGLIKL